MKKKLIYIIASIILVIVVIFVIRHFIGRNIFNVDVSGIDLEVKMERFDLEFQSIAEGNSYEEIEKLENRYLTFFEIYNYEIIAIGGPENSSYLTYVKTFLNDYSVSQANVEVAAEFKNIDDINEDLTGGFKHLKYYFTNCKVPRVVSFVAGFNHSVIIADGFIGVGLDKYLGADCKLYGMLDIPEYSLNEMTREQIAIDVLTAWADSEFLFESKSENLLDYIIYNGRKLYFLYAMFPDFKRERINKYTESQLNFCKTFEREMWTTIVEKKLLFVSDLFTIRKFTEPSPFTSQFGPDSPPRAGNWLGLQIVMAYMENNNISLPDLMEETDFQKILSLSGYDPKYK